MNARHQKRNREKRESEKMMKNVKNTTTKRNLRANVIDPFTHRNIRIK